MRIHIIGPAGSGKSTFARPLATRLSCPYVELDALYWDKHWTPVAPELFQTRIMQATERSHWVLDGEYPEVCPLIWAKTDTVLWLDYPLEVVLWRLLRRSLYYAMSRQQLWAAGNQQSWRTLLGQNSLIRRVYRSHQRRLAHYETFIEQYRATSIQFVRLRSPGMAHQWLQRFLTAAKVKQESLILSRRKRPERPNTALALA